MPPHLHPLIGSFFSLILYGVSCVQTFVYFQTYSNDNLWLKCFVALLWILESAHSGFTMAFNITYVIDGFGDLMAISDLAWDAVVDYEIGFVIILAVNIFFIWRVWMFSRKVWAACLLLCLSIARYVLGTYSAALGFVYTTWASFQAPSYTLLGVTMGLGILEDALLALILAYYLYSKRTQGSAQLITRLLAYVVGTGALTSTIETLQLICLLVSPNSMLYIPFALVQVKIYANSALLSLNLRQYQRKSRPEGISLGDANITSDNSKTLINSAC